MQNVIDSNNPFLWYRRCFRRYADFEGRARRKEYWSFSLINLAIFAVLGFIGAALAEDPDGLAAMIPVGIYLLVAFIPGLAVTVRRLHDTGRSGGWIFVQLVPWVGPLILFVFEVMDGDPGPNRYGPNPKLGQVDVGELETVFS